MLNDIRYALRALARSPGFSAVAILVLAVGIGINTTIFSIVNAVLFRSLPARAPDELLFVYSRSILNGRATFGGTTYPNYEYVRDHNAVFSDVAAWTSDRAIWRRGNDRERLSGELTSGNYFDVLGIRPAIGRAFTRDDDRAGAPPVILISDALWSREFGRAPDVLGSTLQLAPATGLPTTAPGRAYEVIGVMPPGFDGLTSTWSRSDYWIPARQRSVDYQCVRSEPLRGVSMIGRLANGVSAAEAQSTIPALAGHVPERPTSSETMEWTLVVRDRPRASLPFDYRIVPERLATALMVIAAVLLLIAGANLTGMLSARAVVRQSEVAVRLSLGARRWQIARQLLVESLLLAIAGAIGGVLLARALVVAFVRFLPARLSSLSAPMSLDVPLDGRVLMFTVAVSVATGVLVAMAPIRAAGRRDILSVLGGTNGATRAVRSRLRHAILLPQICCSLVLLLIAGSLVRTVIRTEATPPGYDAGNVVVVTFNFPFPPDCGRRTLEEWQRLAEHRRALDMRLITRVRAVPGIESAALSVTTPGDRFSMSIVSQEGLASGAYHSVYGTIATRDYFQTLRIPLIHGRSFDERDSRTAPRVAIVSQSLSEMLWPGRDPIGERIASTDRQSKYPPQWMEVVGVVGEVRHPLSEGGREPMLYTPLDQNTIGARFILARVSAAADAAQSLSTVLLDIDANADLAGTQLLSESIAAIRFPRRLAAAALGISGAMGLLLAGIGLYGVMAYSVAQREHEIGVRTALGAARRDVMVLILKEGLAIAAIGSLTGFALTYAAVRLVSSTLVAIPEFDLVTLIASPAVLAAAILVACYFPARRAARVDPLVALRRL